MRRRHARVMPEPFGPRVGLAHSPTRSSRLSRPIEAPPSEINTHLLSQYVVLSELSAPDFVLLANSLERRGCLRLLTVLTATLAAAFVAGAIAFAAPAAATKHCPHKFGSAQQIVDAGGAVVQEWTVADLQKSATILPGYTPRGQLWESSATVRAVTGTVTPIIPNLYAVPIDGQRHPVLWQIATPEGLPATTLAQGQSSTGKVYFDIVGADPMAVLYADGNGRHLMWCCDQAMQMPMSMDKCPMCAAMEMPCPHCRDRM